MGEETGIAWCDHTFNPWWGCVKISPACKNCYAAAFDHRLGGDHWQVGGPRRFFGDKHWNQPLKWNRDAEKAGKPAKVFCASMADVFEDRPDLVEHRARLWDLVDRTPWLYWLFLTKRPENIPGMLPSKVTYSDGRVFHNIPPTDPVSTWYVPTAPENVWLGTTVESDEYMWRADPLLMVRASVHFLSCEPLLSDLDLSNVLERRLVTSDGDVLANPDAVGEPGVWRFAVDWVITGSESGHGKRPQNVGWFRSLRDQTKRAGKSFFFKQAELELGAGGLVSIGNGPGSWDKAGSLVEQPYLDGVQHIEFPKGHLES